MQTQFRSLKGYGFPSCLYEMSECQVKTVLAIAVSFVLVLVGQSRADYRGWKHSGSVFVLTTPDGANLPSSAVVEDFPLLVRLHKDFFNFGQAQANGDDLRFSTADDKPLAYQIDEWDAKAGNASIWVRVPKITGNTRQEIRLHWGKAEAKSESDGKAVFTKANGFLSVWHMNEKVKDEVGTVESKDTGTKAATGMVGLARHFPGQKGISCGDKIADYPIGAASHTTEAWFRAEKPNGTAIAWGNEHGQGKVVMQYLSPPHVSMDCYFSGANVTGKQTIPLGEWAHIVHTYEKGESRLFVNGVLDSVSKTPNAPLAIKSPAHLFIGGWYDNYNFVGDIDEVRVSRVVRSLDWVRLQYENQKPAQTLAGPVVQSGDTFSVSEAKVNVAEGKSVTLSAKAGGAQKVYWVVMQDGKETVAAVDRISFTLNAGRVVGDTALTVQLRAVYPNEVKTHAVAVTISEAIPEPVFKLDVPATWDGRAPIEIVPTVDNLKAMQAAGAGKLNYSWAVSDIAVIKDIADGKLVLKRAQNSGTLTVRVAIDNGGTPTIQTAIIAVKEPASDPWLARTPGKDEKPVEGQFFPRDDKNVGTLHYTGTLKDAADTVFLKLYADGKLIETATAKPAADKSYALSHSLKPGLIKYKVEFGTKTGDTVNILDTVDDLVCGDAYLIDGQSNAEATDVGKYEPKSTNEWVRSFGSMAGDPINARLKMWGHAVVRSKNGGQFQIGYWGMALAERLVENQKMPVCVINGAVGGSRIDVHQRNAADPTDPTTIYGRLLWRVQQAKLTHGICGILWHQGENDQGADGPTGRYGYETYRQFFVDMAAGWKTDYPNVQHYYAFQIWPKACSMGVNGSDNRLREVQRQLPTLFSKLSVMSTLGIQPPGGCHFPIEGYAEFAKLIGPLVERDMYGKKPAASITAPNLRRASLAGEKGDELVLEFDQPVKWDDKLASEFYLDGEKGKVASGSATEAVVTLKLKAPLKAKTLTYLDSLKWSQDRLLRGENGIAALTFCEVPIHPNK